MKGPFSHTKPHLKIFDFVWSLGSVRPRATSLPTVSLKGVPFLARAIILTLFPKPILLKNNCIVSLKRLPTSKSAKLITNVAMDDENVNSHEHCALALLNEPMITFQVSVFMALSPICSQCCTNKFQLYPQ